MEARRSGRSRNQIGRPGDELREKKRKGIGGSRQAQSLIQPSLTTTDRIYANFSGFAEDSRCLLPKIRPREKKETNQSGSIGSEPRCARLDPQRQRIRERAPGWLAESRRQYDEAFGCTHVNGRGSQRLCHVRSGARPHPASRRSQRQANAENLAVRGPGGPPERAQG